jgi:anion-transporting  ArsA/GET3 family ATPase
MSRSHAHHAPAALTSPTDRNLLHEAVIVCVGSGGVGKTTASAVIALHAALRGRRTLVLTIDPARRLANSLGIDLDHNESQITLDGLGASAPPRGVAPSPAASAEPGGELWAMMLDMKRAFDQVVRRNTADAESAERILSNRFYKFFSSSLAGTQEYSAVEQLYEIAREERYDLIVLDTPPTQHALDFLDAPGRLYGALENSALQWLYRPAVLGGRMGLGLFKAGAKTIRRTLGRFTGGQMLDDLAVFLESLAPLWDGFKTRAHRVHEILHDPSTLFFVVTTPDPLTVREAVYFDQRLRTEGARFGGFLVNRVHRRVFDGGETAPTAAALTAELTRIPGADFIGRRTLERLAPAVLRNAEDFEGLAKKDGLMLSELSADGSTPTFPIPFYSRDIYSLRGLERVRRDLFGDG